MNRTRKYQNDQHKQFIQRQWGITTTESDQLEKDACLGLRCVIKNKKGPKSDGERHKEPTCEKEQKATAVKTGPRPAEGQRFSSKQTSRDTESTARPSRRESAGLV